MPVNSECCYNTGCKDSIYGNQIRTNRRHRYKGKFNGIFNKLQDREIKHKNMKPTRTFKGMNAPLSLFRNVGHSKEEHTGQVLFYLHL